MMMHELLEHSASRVPDKTFLFSESQSVTYSQALDSVRKAAAALQKLGVKKVTEYSFSRQTQSSTYSQCFQC